MSHAVLDELLVATDDEEVLVVVVIAFVARVVPAVGDGFCRFL